MQVKTVGKLEGKPSLNTQSCIKGLLVVRDFCFWAIWAVGAAGSVHKKKLGAFEGGFFMFLGSENVLIFF